MFVTVQSTGRVRITLALLSVILKDKSDLGTVTGYDIMPYSIILCHYDTNYSMV